VQTLLDEGYTHVVDIDIKGYFDSIPQDQLLQLVREQIADGRVLQLLEKFLKAGVIEKEEIQETDAGTPQGGVISPLLANIYLNPLDWLMVKSGDEMVRYADDMVVMCRDAATAANALATVAEWMAQAGLVLHPEKTKIVDLAPAKNHFDFLGYRFQRSRKGRLLRFVRPKSRQKLHARLKPLTRRSNGQSIAKLITLLNPILKGWYGYFKQACHTSLNEMDGWVRERLRGIMRKRRKRKKRVTWANRKEWDVDYFNSLGLFNLTRAKQEELTKLQNEV
jgi:RNA-directed DNA polymerase